MTVESAAPGPRMKSHRSISAGTNLSHAGAASCVVPGALPRICNISCPHRPGQCHAQSKLIFSFFSYTTAAADGNIGVCSTEGSVYLYDPRDHAILWEGFVYRTLFAGGTLKLSTKPVRQAADCACLPYPSATSSTAAPYPSLSG